MLNRLPYSPIIPVILIVLFAWCASGCVEQLYPVDVTEQFWRAVQTNDLDKLRQNITSESANDSNLIEDILPVGGVSLGKTIIDGERAWVDTTVKVKVEDSPSILIKTVLAKEKGLWKVDYTATVATISRSSDLAKVMSSIRELGDLFIEQFDEVIDELQKTIPEVQGELKKLEEHIKSRIPEIKEKLEDFAKELEEALKKPLEESGQPIEI